MKISYLLLKFLLVVPSIHGVNYTIAWCIFNHYSYVNGSPPPTLTKDEKPVKPKSIYMKPMLNGLFIATLFLSINIYSMHNKELFMSLLTSRDINKYKIREYEILLSNHPNESNISKIDECYWYPPLFINAHNNSMEACALLVNKGANINYQIKHWYGNYKGFTALHIAAQKNFNLLCYYLIKLGADENLRTEREGLTPIEIAIKNNSLEAQSYIVDGLKERNKIKNQALDCLYLYELLDDL